MAPPLNQIKPCPCPGVVQIFVSVKKCKRRASAGSKWREWRLSEDLRAPRCAVYASLKFYTDGLGFTINAKQGHDSGDVGFRSSGVSHRGSCRTIYSGSLPQMAAWKR